MGVLIFFTGLLQAQTPFFKRIYINRENSNLKFTSVLEGHDGFLWFGSSEGVYRYDGTDPVLFSIPGKDVDNTVTALYQDTGDTLWIGFKSGSVAYLIHNELTLFEPEEGMPVKPVMAIMKDNPGHLWLATAGEGVYFFNHDRLCNINMDDGLSENYTYTLAPDKSGNMWVGTDGGISLCSATTGKKVLLALHKHDGLPDNIARVLVPDNDGNLWIGMQEKGVCQYLVQQQKIVIPGFSSDWKYGQVNSITLDHQDLWIGTEETGLVYIEKKKPVIPKAYEHFNSMNFPKIMNTCMDREGNIWMIANSNIYQTSASRVMIIEQLGDVKMKMVHSLYFDRQDNLWFTPDQGLVCWSFRDTTAGKLKKFTLTPPEDLIDIVSIYEDECGYIWAGTMGAGLFRLNPGTGRIQKIDASAPLKNASVMSIAGKDHTLWLATLGGAVKLDIPEDCQTDHLQVHTETFENEELLGSFYIYDVFMDKKGRAWFGTDGKGLTCFDHGHFINYNEKDGLKSNVIYSITEDENGIIWFSTLNAGIYRFDGHTFKNYSTDDGLRYVSVSGIESDGKGNILIVHKHGFDVLNTRSETFMYFGSEVGISDINSDLNAIGRDHAGFVCIGTDDEIIRYSAQADRYVKISRAVIIKASLFTGEISQYATHRLSYDQNYISFDFTGLWYTNPDRVKYQYMLESYNKDWVVTRDRRIIFPKLPSGHYTFKVRTSLNRNFRQFSESSFSFYIKPPFWRENWFIFLLSILIAGMIYFFTRYRIMQIRKFESLKKEKIEYQYETLRSQVNPHFLFNSFNTLISAIEEDKQAAIEYVETLSAFFRNIVTYKDHDLITLQEELKIASDYFYLQQRRYGHNLDLRVEVPEEARRKEIPPMVVQIIIENALKHNAISSETPLHISIRLHGSKLEISNNINPKRMVESSTKTGLHNIINRYKLLTAETVDVIHLETEYIIRVPLIG